MPPTSLPLVTTTPAPAHTGAAAANRVPLDEVGTTLLHAAGHILATDGPSALTVRRIAGDAGMSTMNVYSRFGGKQGVVEQLFLEGFAQLSRYMGDAPVTDDPVADLQACGTAYRQFALDHPTMYGVMFEHVVPDYEPSEQAFASGLATLQQLADRIERCMQGGRIRPADPLHVAAIIWGTCHGAVSLEMKQKLTLAIDWAAVYRDACATIVKGLAP